MKLLKDIINIISYMLTYDKSESLAINMLKFIVITLLIVVIVIALYLAKHW